jgi:predicted nucleotidyltransferase
VELMSPQLDRVVKRIVDEVSPVRVVLFGSAARGDTEAHSDLDLLVVMPDGTHRRRTAQRLYRSLYGVGVPVDLVIATPTDLEKYGRSPGLIFKTILAEGQTVYAT